MDGTGGTGGTGGTVHVAGSIPPPTITPQNILDHIALTKPTISATMLRQSLTAECGTVHDDGGFGTWQSVAHPPGGTTVPKALTPARGRMCDGAGVLPIMQPPGKTSTYFLLGRQTFRPTAPLHGGRWYLFGGRPSASDRDTAAIASREFLEETLGTVLWRPTAELRAGHAAVLRQEEELAATLRDHEFIMCLRLLYVRDGQDRFYDVFVLKVPWDPHVPARFAKLRHGLHTHSGPVWQSAYRAHHPALTATGRLKPAFAEVEEIGIWSRNQLRAAVAQHGGTLFNQFGEAAYCRTAFLPILATVLQQLDLLQRSAAALTVWAG
jgi:hypothetical protein